MSDGKEGVSRTVVGCLLNDPLLLFLVVALFVKV